MLAGNGSDRDISVHRENFRSRETKRTTRERWTPEETGTRRETSTRPGCDATEWDELERDGTGRDETGWDAIRDETRRRDATRRWRIEIGTRRNEMRTDMYTLETADLGAIYTFERRAAVSARQTESRRVARNARTFTILVNTRVT